MILLLIALLAGVLTVLAPCTISLLPIIVGGSLAGGTSIRRTLTVTASLGVSVILFTLLLKVSTVFISVPQSFWEIVSGVIIVALGFTMVFPSLWDNLPFVNLLNRDSNNLLSKGFMQQNFIGNVLVGASLGPVFSSCSPTYFLIIATVLPRSITDGLIYLLAYTIGLCVTLLIVASAGQKLLQKFGAASDPKGIFKRAIGVLFILVGLAIGFGLDAQIELAFANSPLFSGFTNLEQQILTKAGPLSLNGNASSTGAIAPGTSFADSSTPAVGADATSSAGRIAAEAAVYPKSPDITGAAGYLNTDGKPISISGEKGNVVLVDFWDYSCINCQREIPYVESWYQKYKNEGLVVIGVHTPEFAFEKLQSNVAAAAQSLGITYPIVLDNAYATWNVFQNEYWPQIYLINSDGFVVYSHSGEGDYAQTEAAIQKALKERDANEGLPDNVSGGTVNPSGTVTVNDTELGSPETYFGSDRNQYLGNGTQGQPGMQTFTTPSSINPDTLYLGGTWNLQGEYAETSDAKSGKVIYQFTAKNMYMVATGNPSAVVKVLLDGKPIGSAAGADVSADGTMTVQADKLYKLVSLPDYGTHTLELDVVSGTLDAYTFTFG